MAKTRKNASKATSDDLQDIKISEEEQWRLVRESGVLSKVAVNTDAKESKSEPDDGPGALAEEIFDAAIIIMPMTFFLILMEM